MDPIIPTSSRGIEQDDHHVANDMIESFNIELTGHSELLFSWLETTHAPIYGEQSALMAAEHGGNGDSPPPLPMQMSPGSGNGYNAPQYYQQSAEKDFVHDPDQYNYPNMLHYVPEPSQPVLRQDPPRPIERSKAKVSLPPPRSSEQRYPICHTHWKACEVTEEDREMYSQHWENFLASRAKRWDAHDQAHLRSRATKRLRKTAADRSRETSAVAKSTEEVAKMAAMMVTKSDRRDSVQTDLGPKDKPESQKSRSSGDSFLPSDWEAGYNS
jgi:hypothetical protein